MLEAGVVKRYRSEIKAFPKSFGNISEKFRLGIGIGVGIGNTNTCASDDARLGELPSIHEPPFGTDLDPLPEELNEKPHNADATKNANGHAPELVAQQKAWFKAWWAEYWHKRSKKTAWGAFRKHVKTEERFQVVMAATRAQTPEMLQREPSKRPYAATWLNGERWEDELQPPAPSTSGVGYRDMDDWKKGIVQ